MGAGGGGTVDPTGTHPYAEGTEVAITATPELGWTFSGWTGDGVADPNSAATTVTMDANKTVTATFTQDEYTLTVTPVGDGSVAKDPDRTTYHYGDTVELTPTADPGWTFTGWSGDLSGSDDPASVTINGDTAVTATFEEYVPSPLGTDGASSSATGAADASGVSFSHTAGTGSDRLLLVGVSWNAGSATGREISSVTFDGTALTPVFTQPAGTQLRYSAIYALVNPASGVTGTVAVTFNGTVTNGIVAGAANFAGVDQTTPLGTPNGSYDDTNNDKAPHVTLTGLSGTELVFDNVFQGASAESQTLTAAGGQAEQWNRWISNTRAAASTKQAISDSVTMSWTAGSASYWAIAAVPINPSHPGPTYDLTTEVGAGGGGTVDPTGTHPYAEGTEVAITATPELGWTFSGWTGDGVADPNALTTTVTMDADKTVTATFTQDEYTLTVNTVGDGSVAKDPDQATYHYGETVELTATPGTDWVFSGWSGDLSGSVNPQSVTMNGDRTVTATFEEYVPVAFGLDGDVSSKAVDDVDTISISHHTGTGSNRLLLVGVSWNGNADARTITSATFTPSGGGALPLTLVKLQQAGTQFRYAAIYSLLNPPSNVDATVTLTFNGAVASGVVAGVANFAGVDQTTPLGTAAGFNGSSQDSTVSVTGLDGDELVFANAFQGASSSSQTLTLPVDQQELWNEYIGNTRAAASTKLATGSSVTMTGHAASSSVWIMTAVPIKPAP